jgi:hypothetical protein
MTIMHDFNPVIFQKGTQPRLVPRYGLGALLERPSIALKLRIGKGKIKGIFFGSKATGEVSVATGVGVDSTKMLLPRVVPVAHVIRYEII